MEKQANVALWCEKVQEELATKDMRVADLAKALDLAEPWVSSVVHGRNMVKATADRVSEVLGIDPALYPREKKPEWCMRAKVAMTEQELRVNQLAANIGISVTTTSKVLNGKNYNERIAQLISDALNIDYEGYVGWNK